MPRRRRRNPWVSTAEVLMWVLFAALLIPVGFAGWAVGHYTSLGKSGGTRTVTVQATVGSTAAATTTAPSAAPATQPAKTTAKPSTTASGNVAAGKTVFASSGCAACHTFAPAGSTGTVGPNLDTAPEQDAKSQNMALVPFLHESIVDPNAYIAPGYPKGIMPETFGKQLSKSQLADLVAFLASGAK